MQCKHCGADIKGHPRRCPECDGRLKKKKPPLPLRLVMHVLSVIFYLVLTVSLMVSVLLTDLYLMTSDGGIETILSHIVNQGNGTTEPTQPSEPSTESFGMVKLSNTILWDESTDTEEPTEEEPSEENLPPISLDALTNPDALVEYLSGLTQDFLGEGVSITPDQMKTIVTESTMMRFISDKVSSYMDDALSGEMNTLITADEIMQLIEENEQLLEETLKIEITEESKANIYNQVDKTIGENNLNETIRDSINNVMEEPIPGFGDMSIRDLIAKIQELSQPKYLIMGYGLSLLLMVLICLLNYYNLPRGLRWSASACLTVATPLCVPLAVFMISPMVLEKLIPSAASVMTVINGTLRVFAPLHFGLLALGVVLMTLSFLGRLFSRLFK